MMVYIYPDLHLTSCTAKRSFHSCFDSQTKVITSQRSVDLLHVAQDLLSQHMNQPGDNLRISPLDGVQGSLRKLGQLGVSDGVNGGGSVHVCQGLHLLKPQKWCLSKTSSLFFQ